MPQVIRGDTVNISESGLYCKTTQFLNEETLVKIFIEQDSDKKLTVDFGTVIRADEVDGGAFSIGCRFRKEPPSELQGLIDAAPPSTTDWPSERERRQSIRHEVSWAVELEVH